MFTLVKFSLEIEVIGKKWYFSPYSLVLNTRAGLI